MLAKKFSKSMCFAIFDLMKFMCIGQTFSYPHKEFLIPRPPRSKYNPHTKQYGFLHPPRKCGYPQPALVEWPRAGLYTTIRSIWTV